MRKNATRLHFPTFILLLAIASLSVSCSFTKGKEYGERAVKKFHEQFNAGQYKEIYQQSDTKFRDAVKEAEFIQFLEAVKRKLGNVEDATPMGWKVNATPMGTGVTLGYEAKFTEGKASEQFIFMVNGEQATLLRYDINSPLLITK